MNAFLRDTALAVHRLFDWLGCPTLSPLWIRVMDDSIPVSDLRMWEVEAFTLWRTEQAQRREGRELEVAEAAWNEWSRRIVAAFQAYVDGLDEAAEHFLSFSKTLEGMEP